MAVGSERDPFGYDQERERAQIMAAQRDPQAFAPLYEHHHKAIYLFIFKRLMDPDPTGDLTQQVFLKALVALPRYKAVGVPFKAWLYRIAMNEMLMYFRSTKGRYFMDVEAADAEALLEEAAGSEAHSTEAEFAALGGVLAGLKPEQASLIELHWFDGLSYAEVGAVLGIGEDAAKMRTHRVLQAIRVQLRRSR